MGITYAQVAAKADEMKAEGKIITSRSIRHSLEDTGNQGTICKHLKEWRATQERQTTTLTLPADIQRLLLGHMDKEFSNMKASLVSELSVEKQETEDLATENERISRDLWEMNDNNARLQAELASLQGCNGQMAIDLLAAKEDAGREREASERARTELAKVSLRLEALPGLHADLAGLRAELEKNRETLELVRTELATSLLRGEVIPRLEADLVALRSEFETESKGRVFAEQQAAVLASKLEAATDRAIKAETAAMDATAQAIKTAEAASQEAAKAESALSTIANLRGKVDTMQEQIQQQIQEIATTRQAVIKATEEAAELRGKLAAKSDNVPQQQTPHK